MIRRELVYNKFNGLCAYSGTPLENDWQIDHLVPKRLKHFYESEVMKEYINANGNSVDDIDNLLPCQKLINHYKRGLPLEDFRKHWLGGLHKRLLKLPKNPKTEKSKRHKEYMLRIAGYFNIKIDNPFSGKFYFEQNKKESNNHAQSRTDRT